MSAESVASFGRVSRLAGCFSLKYCPVFSVVSRLAIRAPRAEICSRFSGYEPLVRLCHFRCIRPKTGCSANRSTARETASPATCRRKRFGACDAVSACGLRPRRSQGSRPQPVSGRLPLVESDKVVTRRAVTTARSCRRGYGTLSRERVSSRPDSVTAIQADQSVSPTESATV